MSISVEALQQQLEQVRSERDEISRDLDSEHYHRLAVERDRDALAAHVERLQAAGGELRAAWDLSHLIGVNTRRTVKVWDQMLEEGPATSLARRDAAMKAKALEDIASRPIWCTVYAAKASVLEIAGMHRKQAEGGGDA